MSRRTERVEEMLREEISIILQRELRDPGIGFVTITGADVSPDLSHAKVFVSIMGAPKEKEQSLKALQRARGFIRTALGKRAHLRQIPEISFQEDDTAETGSHIFELLQKVKNQGDHGD